jgi:hypothetical protein
VKWARLRRALDTGGDALSVLALGLGAFLLYLRTLAPSVTGVYEDTLEFQVVCSELGIAHPTGYPLYTLLGKLFTFLPFGDLARRVNLLSAVCAALTVPLVYLLARQLAMGDHEGRTYKPRRGAALGAAAAFAVTPAFWSQAVVAEVYALNALFVALALYLTLRVGQTERREGRHSERSEESPTLPRRFFGPAGLRMTMEPALGALAFVLGLSLTHHRTIVLLFPAVAVYLGLVWYQARRQTVQAGPVKAHRLRHTLLLAGKLALFFLLPLLLYLYLPLRGRVISSLDGSYQNTLAGFVGWVSGRAYTAFLTANPMAQAPRGLGLVLDLWRQQFGWLGLALGALGLVAMLLRQRRGFVLVVLGFLAYVAFALVYKVADVEVFFIPAFMLFALWIGAGLDVFWQVAAGLRQRYNHLASRATSYALSAAGYALAIALPAVLLLTNLPLLDRSEDWAAHDYGRDVLRQPLPIGATLVGIRGEMTLLRYFQHTEGLRPDLVLVAADQDEQRRAAVAAHLSAGNPVYLTRPLPGAERSYALAAQGPLIGVRPSPNTSEPSPQHPRSLRFAGQIALLGYDLETKGWTLGTEASSTQNRARTARGRVELNAVEPVTPTVEANAKLRVTLYWRALPPLAKDYKVSLRLVSAAGRLVAQQDATPVHDAYPTSAWRPGEIVTDVYDLSLPLGTPPGDYRLVVGWYVAETLQTLSPEVPNPDGLADLGPIVVLPPARTPSLDWLPAQTLPPRRGLTLPGGEERPSLASLGVPRVVRGNLDNQITLFAYGLSPATVKPGEDLQLTFLWQAARRLTQNYVVFIQLVDKEGKVWASRDSIPADGTYPTTNWLADEVVRDEHTLAVPAAILDGEYRLLVGMYRSSDKTDRLTVLRWTRSSGDHLDLGPVRVQGRPRSFEPPPLTHRQEARLGKEIKFLGYDLAGSKEGVAFQARPGDTLKLTLYWQALGATDLSYTVFAHLLGADGRLRAQQDNPPCRGACPTTSWVAGEVLADEYAIAVPADAAPGEYRLEIGLYDGATQQRLPVFDAQGQPAGDRLLLGQVVQVRP